MPFTSSQVSGISIDQFRSAVNYNDMVNRADRANKGYVRFASGANHTVTLAKVNNKIDVAISARIGINSANNKLIRRQFLKSIAGDLVYFPEKEREAIEKLILKGDERAASVKGETVATPLSRRDIARVFSRFDENYNTASGRRKIVENILRESALAHELTMGGDVDRFCRKVFNCSKEEFMARYADAFAKTPDATVLEKTAHQDMLMSEGEFRGLLITIREIVDANAVAAKTEDALQDTVRGWVQGAVKGSFGFELSEHDRTNWKNALRPVIAGYDCTLGQKDVVGADYREKMLDLFVDVVLKHELKTALDNVFALDLEGEDKAQDREDVIKAYITYDAIEDLAIDFFSKASDPKVIGEIGKMVMGANDDAQLAATKNVVNDFIENFLKVGSFAKVKMDTAVKVMTHAAVNRREANAIGQSIANGLSGFANEARLDWFVKMFIATRYADEVAVGSKVDETSAVFGAMTAKASDAADRAVVAAQSVYGIRVVEFDEKGKVAGVRNGENSMGTFANKVMNTLVAPEILKELGCTEAELCAFMTHTFPNVYADIKAELIKAGQGEVKAEDLFSDDNAAKMVFKLKESYQALRKEVAGYDKAAAAYGKVFAKMLQRNVRGGKITETEANAMKAAFAAEAKTLRAAAAKELSLLMPLGADEAKAKKALWIMKDAVAKLRANMNHQLSSLLLVSSYGYAQKKELMTEANVRKAVTDWLAKNGSAVADPLKLNLVTSEEIEGLHFAQFVADFEKSLTDKLPKNTADLREKDVKAIQDDFAKKVDRKFSDFKRYETAFLTQVEEDSVAVIVDALKNKPNYAGLAKAEKETLAREIVHGVILSHRSDFREMLFDYVDHEGRVDKPGDLADKVLDKAWFGQKVDEIMAERGAEFDRWMEGGRFRDRLEAQIFDIFKGDARAAGVSEAELQRMISTNGKAFFEQAEKVKGFMISGGKLAFFQKASEAVTNGLAARLEAFASFKTEFLAKVEAVESKYATLPGKEAARAECLLGLAMLPPGDRKLAKELDVYDKLLFAKLNGFVEGKKEEFLDYRANYEDAYDNVQGTMKMIQLPELTETLRDEFINVDGVGLDREAILKDVVETFRKDFTEVLGYQIARAPGAFRNGVSDKLDPTVQSFGRRMVEKMKAFEAGALDDAQIDPEGSPWARMDDLIRDLGFGYYLAKDNLLTDRLHAHLNTFMKGDRFLALQTEAIKAAAAQTWAEVSGGPVPQAAVDAIAAYRQGVEAEIKAFIATTDNVETLNGDVELAYAKIDLELKSRDLPDETDAYGADVRERTRQNFVERVKEEAQKMFAASAKGEAYTSTLMTPASLKAFVDRIESDCLTTYMAGRVEGLADKICSTFIARNSVLMTAIVYDGPTDTDEGARLAAMVAQNRTEIRAAIGAFVTALTQGCYTFAEFKACFNGEDSNNVLASKAGIAIATTVEKCMNRANFERGQVHAVETATISFEEAIFRWMFATEIDKEAPVKSLDELDQMAKANKEINYLANENKWAKHRMAIRNFCAAFRTNVENHLARLRTKDAQAVYPVVNVVRDYGNKYLDEFLCNEDYAKDQKALITDFAAALAKPLGIKIQKDRNGIFGFLKNIF